MRYSYRSIKDIPEEHRPREKLKKLGPEKLSDEELLAVILGSGTREIDVLTLSRLILDRGWREIGELPLEELTKIKGMGMVKALQIKALLELAKRIGEPFGGEKVLSPEKAYEILRGYFDDRKESLIALYLDLSHRVRGVEVVAVGGLNRVYASPKEIIRPALELSAYGIILAHNHPQGELNPSEEDISFTRRVKEACDIVGFELVDHIIVNRDGFLSMRERGLM